MSFTRCPTFGTDNYVPARIGNVPIQVGTGGPATL